MSTNEKLRDVIREFYKRAHEGEPTRDVFLKAKALVKGVTVSDLQASSNENGIGESELFLSEEMAPPRQKRKYQRRQSSLSSGSEKQVQDEAPLIHLTLDQLQKLWGIVVGGQLIIKVEEGQVVCRVSLESFNKALPVLLEKL